MPRVKANVRGQKKALGVNIEAAKQRGPLPPSLDTLEDDLRAAGFTKLANMEKKIKRLLTPGVMDAIEREYSKL